MSSRCRPNFFIGFKLTSPHFMDYVHSIHDNIRLTHPELQKCITPSSKLHFTAVVMELKSKEQVSQAINCFYLCKPLIETIIIENHHIAMERNDIHDNVHSVHIQPSVDFGKIESFGTKVLYIDPIPNEKLHLLRLMRSIFFERFQQDESGFLLEIRKEEGGDRDRNRKEDLWIPHATIMKTSADKKNGYKLKIRKEEFQLYEERLGFEVPILSIDLLSMTEKDETGYYKSYASISFPYILSIQEIHSDIT